MASFYIPLTGLNADSTSLNTIANNLSNMNTTGYKAQTTSFSDLLYQEIGTSGSGDEIQVGSGVQVAANSTDFTGGSISSTDVSTDAAINGTGFFVLNDGGSQLYTRNGTFQLSPDGTLETSGGLPVRGYAATAGVVNTNGGLTNINIPTGQAMRPSATTNFSMTQNLNALAAPGTQTSGEVQVYDSLGKSYQATVSYTNVGTNTWDYSVTMPDTLTPVPAAQTTVSAAVTPTATTSTNVTTTLYGFGSSNGTLATVDPSTSLTIAQAGNATTVGPLVVTPGESLAIYAGKVQAAVTAAGFIGTTVSVTASNQLSIVGPAAAAPANALTIGGAVDQNLVATNLNYNFGSSGGTLSTVDPTTNLTITGSAAGGGTATISAPTVTPGETVGKYATDLQAAITKAGIANVTVQAAGGVLTVSGANVTTTGTVIQDPIASTNSTGNLVFDSSGNLISPALDVSGISFGGLSDGAATLNLNFNLFNAKGQGNISQTAGTSTTSATSQNGYTSGQYENFGIGSDGTVTATYSNGQTQTVGQLALATVANLQGLVAVGSSDYQATSASGDASVGVAGSGGRGTLEGSSLEASNVNISAEFSDLIIAQRAFEANSKTVTTFDTITQETINMIH